jgi:hypothetical protein
MIANFGSGATSVRSAEYMALKYYWWFVLLTAFTGASLTNMVLNGVNAGERQGVGCVFPFGFRKHSP